MKKAGVDCGLTCDKIYWIDERGAECFLSSRVVRQSSLVSVLEHLGVRDICIAGNGSREAFEKFRHHVWPGDPIQAELRLQARGAQHQMICATKPLETKHIVVGIGTGMSFTVVNGEGYDFPVGSPYSAGSIDGLLEMLDIASGEAIDGLLEGKEHIPSYDLMLGEAVPSLRGTPYEQWVAASFAKAARETTDDPITKLIRGAKSVIQHLATDLASRLLLFERIPEFRGIRDVVIVGTMPHKSNYVRATLEAMLRKIGKTPYFPPNADYALAIGAYHAINP
ncbi:MAG: hypothetical protein WC866_00810 [Patescibacteria group bacterium]|jgi:hypothetical protein